MIFSTVRTTPLQPMTQEYNEAKIFSLDGPLPWELMVMLLYKLKIGISSGCKNLNPLLVDCKEEP